MLCSIEALYNITKSNIEKLQSCDTYLWRKLFQTEQGCPILSYYNETNSIPPCYLLVGRRLMFLWSILSRPKTALVRQVYDTQNVSTEKYDWVSQIQHDLADCNIFLTDEQISQMPKTQFKQLVKQGVEKLTDELIDNNRGSKMSQLGPRKLQEYLS